MTTNFHSIGITSVPHNACDANRSKTWQTYGRTNDDRPIESKTILYRDGKIHPEYHWFEVHDKACACRVVYIAYLWHEGGFPCPCTKLWLIIFLLPVLFDSIWNFILKVTKECLPIRKRCKLMEHLDVTWFQRLLCHCMIGTSVLSSTG